MAVAATFSDRAMAARSAGGAALVRRAGGQVESVHVAHRPRASGQSHYGIGNRLWVGIIDMMGVMWLQRRARVPRVERLDTKDPR